MMLPRLIASEPFVPHPWQHLQQMGVFPPDSLPETAYDQMLARWAALTGVSVHSITYESDGLSITGLAAMPIAPTPGSHPIMIYNRGGSGEYGKLTLHSVLRSMAPFAQQGYLVLASNYRGNGGGEGSDEFGGDDVRDVLNLITMVQAHTAWDGENIYMLGHSRGAMMLYLCLKAGLKLTAAAALAGVSDLTGSLQAEARMEDLYRRRIPGFLDHPEESLRERSAICWPEAITAPLLLLHGTADTVVPHSQSEQLAGALATLHKPHELHLYEGGNHALLRPWDDVLERVGSWFDEFRI